MLNEVFSPMKINNCMIPNRLVVPAMVSNYCTEDGYITDRYISYIEEKAKGGFGLIITEDYCVQPHAKGYAYIPSLYEDAQIEANKRLTNAVHKHGSKIFCQMYHPGRQTTRASNGNVTPVAPSAIKDPVCMEQPREITVAEIHELVENFGKAALRVKEAGFDGIEVHAAHGYLIAEFLSSYINKRTDEYGGCFDNRVRILNELYESVRNAVGNDFPVTVRLSGNEYVVGGRTEAESYELARYCNELGFDAIHVSNGVYASDPLHCIIGPMYTNHALNMDTAAQVKQLVDVPVILTNRINDPMMADTLLKMGKADFIGIGRGSIADPYLPNKAKNGKSDTIRYCIGCLEGCQGPCLVGGIMTCVLNPRVGREYENDLHQVESPKKVMVIGGGPAGLVAAETAALRGHHVSVYEKNHQLGGQFIAASYPLGKGELSTFASSLRKSLENLNVPIYMNTEATEDLFSTEKPDAIIIATGAVPAHPPIKGIDNANVATAEDILLGNVDIKTGPIVVCGGGEVGAETANFITQVNHDVTILEMQDEILKEMNLITKFCLLPMIKESGIKVKTKAKVTEITESIVSFIDENGDTITIPADQVVSAFGYKSVNILEETARKNAKEVYVVGSAVKSGNVMTATKEGYEAGLRI